MSNMRQQYSIKEQYMTKAQSIRTWTSIDDDAAHYCLVLEFKKILFKLPLHNKNVRAHNYAHAVFNTKYQLR